VTDGYPGLLDDFAGSIGSASPGWLTGSQQFQMMKGVSETLAGRVGILNLLGFPAREREKRDAVSEPFLPVRKNLG
jgi:hypothetical protein